MKIRLYLLGLVVALAVPLVALLGWRIHDERQRAINDAEALLATQVAIIATNMDSKLRQVRHQLEHLASLPTSALLDPAHCAPTLTPLLKLHPEYANIVTATSDGLSTCSGLPFPDGKRPNVSDTPWHRQLLAKRHFLIGEPFFGPIAQKEVLIATHPILDTQQSFLGSINITIALSSFDPNLPQQHLPEALRYGFLNDNGVLIWRNRDMAGQAGKPVSDEAGRRILEVRNGSFRASLDDGILRHYVVKPVPEFGLVAFAALPVDGILAASRFNAIKDSGIAGAAILILLVLAFLVARRIEAPVVALEKAARTIREGDSTVRATPSGPAEIAHLAIEFNALHESRLAFEQALTTQTRQLEDIRLALSERMKEMQCLYSTASLSEDLTLPLPDLVAGTARLLPPAWFYPESAIAEVVLDEHHFATGPFQPEFATQRANIVVNGVQRGYLAVAYREARPPRDEGPFLAEERTLLEAIAQRLASVIKRRIAADRLVENEERFRTLFEETAQALTLVEDGRFVAANRASLTMLGFERLDQLLGHTPVDISPERQPDGQASAEKVHQVIREAESSGWNRFEWEHLRADGSPFLAEVLVTAVRKDGRSQLHVVWRDITAEKRAQVELENYRRNLEQQVAERTAELQATASELRFANAEQQALFQAASVGIVYVRDRRILRCNRSIEKQLGYAPGEMIGRTTRDWYADDATYVEIGQTIATALQAHGIYREDRELLRKDGSRFWARMTAQLLDTADPGKGLVGITEDITAERQAFEAISRAKVLAEEAARVKSDFVANMSHEIRTPMNAVIGLTHLALQTPLSDKQRDYLEKIQASSHHLLTIINDILDFSKIDAGKLVIERIEFPLESVLNQVTAIVAEKAAAKGLELLIRIDPAVPLNLLGDPVRIGQVLINYLNNALKFTERGEILIVVSVADATVDAPLLRFEVRDTGIGIAPEQRDRLFRSFEQADTSTTRKYGGTGLGLAISKRLAGLMGGDVGVVSEVGRGSSFWFTVRAGVGSPRPMAQASYAGVRGRRMLLVDDNEQVRQILGEMLGGMGFVVDTAASGSEALAAIPRAEAAGRPYEIAFIDWKMPELDGIAVAQGIRELQLTKPPRCVMLTAFGQGEVQEQARAVGIEHVLDKPVTPSSLFDTAMQLLALRLPQAQPSAPVQRHQATSLRSNGAYLLLVEDNDINQQVALELLSGEGYRVDVANHGAEALEMVQKTRYDLILMDMQMPVMDGLEATRRIRQIPRLARLPILAMTANAMVTDRETCLAAGMNDHIAKPIQPEVLKEKIAQWLQGPVSSNPTPVYRAGTPEIPPGLQQVDGLDVATGLRLALNRPGLYLSMLGKFVEGSRGFVSGLQETLAQGDHKSAKRAAHTLKGSAAQIGAENLRSCAEQLEQAISQEAAPALIAERIEATGDLLCNLINRITPHLPRQN